ncbi:MAG: helix-turn-helix domain-containing protein [Alistipes sp.]|nr:helix-turn-helix domain-containing protein [Alistipes sp.]
MESDYLTMESEEVRELVALIDQADETLKLADKNYRPLVSLENHLTGSEVCGLLHISLRTLQTLRDRRQIPFVAISDRNILYPETAIREMLMQNYRPVQDPF